MGKNLSGKCIDIKNNVIMILKYSAIITKQIGGQFKKSSVT